MTVDTATPRSRRAILAASLGGAAALVANALGRPLNVNAANGDPMEVGGEYTSTAVTYIENSASGDAGIAFWGASPASIGLYGSSSTTDGVVGEGPTGVHGYGGAVGVQGEATSQFGSGVLGIATNNVGVRGQAATGIGVQGLCTDGPGVLGSSWTGPGVLGQNENNGPGIVGFSTNVEDAPTPAAPAKTGVYGISTIDANSRGVTGETTSGRGVNGVATNGRGVHGQASSGRGLHGQATSGRGVHGQATTGTAGWFEALGTGRALHTVGPVTFEKSVGVATIANGNVSVAVTPGVDLTASSAVVATLQGDAGGSTSVKRVAVNATANTFTIYLTAATVANVKVAWHVFG